MVSLQMTVIGFKVYAILINNNDMFWDVWRNSTAPLFVCVCTGDRNCLAYVTKMRIKSRRFRDIPLIIKMAVSFDCRLFGLTWYILLLSVKKALLIKHLLGPYLIVAFSVEWMFLYSINTISKYTWNGEKIQFLSIFLWKIFNFPSQSSKICLVGFNLSWHHFMYQSIIIF